jgi:hypothetical protein
MKQMEQGHGGAPGGSADWRPPRLRPAADWELPLLLGACPSAALILASLLPQTGPVAWGPEVLALGATPCLLGVLDVSAADWRSDGGEGRRLGTIVGSSLALALALLAVISAVNLAMPAVLHGVSLDSSGVVAWLLLLAGTTVICAAFITGSYADKQPRRDVLHGALAWIGFCLPLVVALTIDVFDPSFNSGPFAGVAVYLYALCLGGVVVVALSLAALAGLLGGQLRCLWNLE